MAEPQRQRRRLFVTILKEHPVVGVRAVVTWYLGPPPTRSDITAARRSAHAMAAAGECRLQQIASPADQGGRQVLVMARPHLGLEDWPSRDALRAIALPTHPTPTAAEQQSTACSPHSTRQPAPWTTCPLGRRCRGTRRRGASHGSTAGETCPDTPTPTSALAQTPDRLPDTAVPAQ